MTRFENKSLCVKIRRGSFTINECATAKRIFCYGTTVIIIITISYIGTNIKDYRAILAKIYAHFTPLFSTIEKAFLLHALRLSRSHFARRRPSTYITYIYIYIYPSLPLALFTSHAIYASPLSLRGCA